MKKLIVGLFAMMFALGMQAATVNWHFSITGEDMNAEEIAGTVTLFFNDALIGTATYEYGAAEADVQIDSAGGTLRAVSEITNFSDGAGTLEYSYIIPSLPLPGYPDVESSLAAISLTMEQGLSNDYSLDLSAGVEASGYTPVGPTPPVIPEPTTGLLVLIGVAGLALRRRRA